MPDLADLYPGFASHWIDTSAGKIFARAGGSGPPLMLLHGYAQTNVMWHKVAAELAKQFALVIPDLPGYGWSAVPAAGPDHAPSTKRAMAAAMVEVMKRASAVDLAGRPRRNALSLIAPYRFGPCGAPRNRADLCDVARHRRAPRLSDLALDLPGAAGAGAGGRHRPGCGRILELEDRARHQIHGCQPK